MLYGLWFKKYTIQSDLSIVPICIFPKQIENSKVFKYLMVLRICTFIHAHSGLHTIYLVKIMNLEYLSDVYMMLILSKN